MQDLQQKDINGMWKSKCYNSLFVKAKIFVDIAKKGYAFLIYVFPMLDIESPHHEIPS
jgi:hypothetical protein